MLRVCLGPLLALALLPGSAHAASWSVRVGVTPNPMPYSAAATIQVRTHAGASCSPRVVYNNGKVPTSFRAAAGVAVLVPARGVLSWSWHEQTKSSGGTAIVSWRYAGVTKTGSASFVVTH
jgi:hypothetical protein